MSKQTKIYAVDPDPRALEQFNSAMENKYAIKGALMADAHVGYSLPIGGVVATKGAIFPAWVGYDLGCGICALPLSIKMRDLIPHHNAIFEEIYNRIPIGLGKHHPKNAARRHNLIKNWFGFNKNRHTETLAEIWEIFGGYEQLGTLGSGNHFIEIGYDSSHPNGDVWIIIHSGSRGIGWHVAEHYMCLAADSDKPLEGHYPLLEGTEEFNNYVTDMGFCLNYALMNRTLMMKVVYDIIREILPECCGDFITMINRNHNHAALKKGMWIHRKGATHAERGMRGVIPGNMRDGSFIVKGKGNLDSLWSSSHGAGRVLGRNQAKRQLSLGEFKQTMKGITARVEDRTIDESPMAYKNIFDVMELQRDLVETVVHIKPLINVKG